MVFKPRQRYPRNFIAGQGNSIELGDNLFAIGQDIDFFVAAIGFHHCRPVFQQLTRLAVHGLLALGDKTVDSPRSITATL